MKFILNKDRLELEDVEQYNSGSINYYEAEVLFDESWQGLTIEAKFLKKNNDKGIARAVINNKVYFDKEMFGTYLVGFIGYKIIDDQKVYQISTNAQYVYFNFGAGEIETEGEEIPTPSEWEIYVAQIQEFIEEGQQIIDEANRLDVDSDGTILTITKKNGTTKEVNVKGEKGDCNFATFEVNEEMELVMYKTENMLLDFRLNENGELEVLI